MKKTAKFLGLMITIVFLMSCSSISMQPSKQYFFSNSKLTFSTPSGWILDTFPKNNESNEPLNTIQIDNKVAAQSDIDSLYFDKEFMRMELIGERSLEIDDPNLNEKSVVKFNNISVYLSEPNVMVESSSEKSYCSGIIYSTNSRVIPVGFYYFDNGKFPVEFEAILNSMVIEQNKY